MRALGASRTSVAPGGVLAGNWARDPLWKNARAVPSLDLRFAENKSLTDAKTGASLVTFTRASTGTYVGSDGLLQSATTNEARFDHNPTTGESIGLLVEEARTNLLLNSATLSTQSVTVAAAANTLSFYGTGTVTLTGVSTAGPLVGTGANNRVSLTFTPIVGVLILTVSGSVTNAQLEAGAFATSYIPTTTATVTRAADVASITGTNFSSFYSQMEGTVFQSFTPFSFGATTTNQTSVAFTDGTSSNLVGLTGGVGPSTREHLFMRVRVSASDVVGTAFSPLILNLPDNTLANCSFAFAADNYGGSCNGGTPVQVSSGALPSGINTMSIMSGFSALNGHVRRLTYWPVRLANPTLQSITTP